MDKRHTRSLPREARKSGADRYSACASAAGPTPGEIADHTKLSRTGVFDISKRYAHERAASLRDKPSGRSVNRGRALTEQQEVDIRVLLRNQLKMSFAPRDLT